MLVKALMLALLLILALSLMCVLVTTNRKNNLTQDGTQTGKGLTAVRCGISAYTLHIRKQKTSLSNLTNLKQYNLPFLGQEIGQIADRKSAKSRTGKAKSRTEKAISRTNVQKNRISDILGRAYKPCNNYLKFENTDSFKPLILRKLVEKHERFLTALL